MRKSPIILFSMFLIILSLLFINSIDTYGDESWETYDGNEYNFKKHTQGGDYYSEITGYEGTTDTLIIEASLEGYAVSILSDNSFSGSSFSIVVVPPTVKTIDNNAFSNCNNLEAIYFLGEMPAIDSNAIPADVDVFYNPIFSDAWTIGSPFTVIDNNGVKYCLIGDEAYVLGRSENSGNNITISSKVSIESEEYEVKKILPYSFFKDEVLVSVVIEEGISIIEERAFMYCSNLKSITFPNSLRIIDAESFRMDIPLNKESSYSSLIELNIPNGVEYLGFECFRMNCLLKEITIPDSVTSLKEGALRGCFKVENVVIGSNVTEISDWMLDNCYKLKSVTFKGNISSIGASAFTEDESLENLIFQGDCPEFVGASAFSGCLLLKSFPFQTLRNIGNHAFAGCMSLGEVSIPLCETIGNSAFEGSGLTEISLGDISFIGEYAFVDCINLKSISVDAELYYSIDGVLFQDDALLCYPAGKNDSTYTIPNGIHSIVSRGFEECAAYKIILPEGFESIGDRAFVASSIKTMDLPSSVSIIGSRVFYDCYELDWVHFLGDVPTYSLESFSGTREDFVIYYDAEHSEGWPSQISKRTVAVWSDNNDANTINTPIIVGSVGFVVLIIGIAMFLNRK